MKIRVISLISGMVLFSALAFAQGGNCYPAGVVLLDTGRPANGATVSVCTAGGTFPGCTSTTSLFTTPALSVGASNPVTTDTHGNFGFCAAAGVNYDLQITGTGITPLTIKNLPLPPTSPITAASLTSSSANPANVGQIKLATGDCLDWRNNANTGNIQLCKDTSDALDLTAFSAVKPLVVSASQTGGGSVAGIRVQAVSPFASWQATGQAADQKWWDCGANALTFICRAVNDANTVTAPWVTVNRGAGASISTIVFGGSLASPTVTSPTTTGTDNGTETLGGKTIATPVQGEACQGNCITVIPGYARLVSQTTAVGATTVFTTGAADTLYLAQLSVNCRSASASATVTGNITWTDVSGTVLTAPSSTATCTTLGLAAQGGETISIQAKAATNIQFSTSIANTPTYDVRVAISQPGTN